MSYGKYINDRFVKKMNNIGCEANLVGLEEWVHCFVLKDVSGIIEKLTIDDFVF